MAGRRRNRIAEHATFVLPAADPTPREKDVGEEPLSDLRRMLARHS
jgi:hypothetical protein